MAINREARKGVKVYTDYKAKIEAEIVLNSSNLTRYESERQEVINRYLSDDINPPDWYLETTSRIINSTKSRIENPQWN